VANVTIVSPTTTSLLESSMAGVAVARRRGGRVPDAPTVARHVLPRIRAQLYSVDAVYAALSQRAEVARDVVSLLHSMSRPPAMTGVLGRSVLTPSVETSRPR
jgi:hypothetical protein